MNKFLFFLIPPILVAFNIPGMLMGHWLSFMVGGFILGMWVAAIINEIIIRHL